MPRDPAAIHQESSPSQDIYQVLSHLNKVQTEIEASATHPPLKKQITQQSYSDKFIENISGENTLFNSERSFLRLQRVLQKFQPSHERKRQNDKPTIRLRNLLKTRLHACFLQIKNQIQLLAPSD